MKAYTLKKHKETAELHLFEGEMTLNNPNHKCTSDNTSVCKKMKKTDSKVNVFSCVKEQEARGQCAELGREVCGICVSHLYAGF